MDSRSSIDPDPILDEPQEEDHPRYVACGHLWDAGIVSAVWCEDALSNYGVPTVVFDLFLLVHDPEGASRALARHGYKRTEMSHYYADLPEFAVCPRVALTDGDGEGVILLPASEWKYALPHSTSELNTFFPPLPEMLDALITVYTDLEPDQHALRVHLGVLIGYFYLYLHDVRVPNFGEKLKRENRQLHYDMLVENDKRAELSSLPAYTYHRMMKNKIISGDHDPSLDITKPIKTPLDPDAE